MDKMELSKRLEQLVGEAAAQEGRLEMTQVLDHFRDVQMTPEEKAERKSYYEQKFREITEKAEAENYDILFLDELIYTIRAGLFDEEILVEYLKHKPEYLEVILTGQNPGDRLIQLADYVSEIRKMKHPFDAGLPARKGIEK